MASENTFRWIKKNHELIGETILEIGSRQYGQHSALNLRNTLCKNTPVFIGCDIAIGENVDVVLDITDDLENLEKFLGGLRFNTIFCVSVLEHIADVITAARNITQLLVPGGALFLSVPFAFRFHGYPNDFWRFTPEGVIYLFPDLDFESETDRATISTLKKGEIKKLPDTFRSRNRFMYRPKSLKDRLERKKEKADFLTAAEEDGPWQGEVESVTEYSLAPTMINLIGIR